MFVPKSILSGFALQLTESPLFIPVMTPKLCIINRD